MWRHHSALMEPAGRSRCAERGGHKHRTRWCRPDCGSAADRKMQQGTFVQFDAGKPSAKLFLGSRYQFTGTDRQFLQSERRLCPRTTYAEGSWFGISGISRAHA